MREYCVSFQTSVGKLGITLKADSPEQAKQKAIDQYSVGDYIAIEVIPIIINQERVNNNVCI
jgi:hypothetical protein